MRYLTFAIAIVVVVVVCQKGLRLAEQVHCGGQFGLFSWFSRQDTGKHKEACGGAMKAEETKLRKRSTSSGLANLDLI